MDVNADGTETATGKIELSESSFTYNGNSQEPPTVNVKDNNGNVVPNDQYRVTYKDSNGEKVEVTDIKDAGTYTVVISPQEGANYTVNGTATFQIKKASLTVTAKDKTITYGDEAANDGVTYDGFVDGEGENIQGVLSGELTYIYKTMEDGSGDDYTEGSPVDTYYIIPGGLESSNYAIKFNAGKLKVEPMDVNADGTETATGKIELRDSLFTYDGNSQKPSTVTVKDKNGKEVPDDQYWVTYKDSNGKKVEVKDIKDAGTYSVVISPREGANYIVKGTAKFWILWLKEPDWKDKFNKLVKDEQNVNRRKGNIMSEGIRSGNTLILPDSREPEMNYKSEEYEWKYIWKLDDNTITVDNIPVTKTEGKMKLTCEAVLSKKDGDNTNNITITCKIYEDSITVYPKPDVETITFKQKGKGTSGTYIIGQPAKGESLEVGVYDETNKSLTTVNVNMNERWFKLENHQNDSRLCIYVVHSYKNGVKITSDILMVTIGSSGGGRVSWDGSTYGPTDGSTYTANTAADITRSEDETTEVESVDGSLNSGVSEVYTINGAKTATMTRGLNIIRMEDGTVRKVFKK